MNTGNRKFLAASWIGMVFLLAYPVSETAFSADMMYCVNCGTEVTQLASKLHQAQQVATAAKQLQNQINQYANMLTNTKGFSTQVWGNTLRDLAKLNNLIRQSRALAHTAGNLEADFTSRYGTYRSYISQKMSESDWTEKYSQWSEEASDNSLYTLKALGLQAQQMSDENVTLRQLETLATSAEGRMQAIQVANMMAAQGVRQTQKLRQLMMLQLQMQANYLASQQDKEAARAAATQQFRKPGFLYSGKGKGF